MPGFSNSYIMQYGIYKPVRKIGYIEKSDPLQVPICSRPGRLFCLQFYGLKVFEVKLVWFILISWFIYQFPPTLESLQSLRTF